MTPMLARIPSNGLGRLRIEPRVADRWQVTPSTARGARTMLVLVAGSILMHAVFVATLVVTAQPPPPLAPHEIAVEIVQDVPKPPTSEPPTAAAKPDISKRALAKPDQPKPDQPKAEQPKLELPKVAHATPERAKVEQAKVEQAKVEQARPEPAKAQQAPAPKPPAPIKPPQMANVAPPAPQPPATKPAADTSQLEALEKELADLKAEHAALETAAPSGPPAGSGALAKSYQAVALPGAGGGDGEAVSYQELVFSQLAKAKGMDREQGLPGTAGVSFEVDEAGALVSVDIASPSGISALDAEALAIVRRAAPFPPPPKGAEHRFYANVNFVPQAAP